MNSCEGYTNYQTWNVALWIANDEGTYTFWQEQKDADNLPQLLQNWVEEMMPELPASMFSDILSHGLAMVDWHEVAESVKG